MRQRKIWNPPEEYSKGDKKMKKTPFQLQHDAGRQQSDNNIHSAHCQAHDETPEIDTAA